MRIVPLPAEKTLLDLYTVCWCRGCQQGTLPLGGTPQVDADDDGLLLSEQQTLFWVLLLLILLILWGKSNINNHNSIIPCFLTLYSISAYKSYIYTNVIIMHRMINVQTMYMHTGTKYGSCQGRG